MSQRKIGNTFGDEVPESNRKGLMLAQPQQKANGPLVRRSPVRCWRGGKEDNRSAAD